jgi:hypothetical protein
MRGDALTIPPQSYVRGKIMGKFIDLTGQKFLRLLVTECVGRNKRGLALWRCKCECGQDTVVSSNALRSKRTKSCGCYAREIKSIVHTKYGDAGTRLYRIWDNMIRRCEDGKQTSYQKKGISICEEWHDYNKFKKWALSNGYDDNLTIDRINNNSDYYPHNCRWVNMKIQNNNTSRNRIITFGGKTQTMAQWADYLGINYHTLSSRINWYKWPIEKALTEKVGRWV